ncbi:hypothetical protein ACSYAF_07900 [Edwardsiella tarda]|uniref:hypothetical protein n=1 Tax=Edwardsiella tarda TaxID=636 RepID=UPI00266FFF03|nr:hypothetical protein [Edwardsiella tarda]WKS82674.1 hypothetical protein NHU85_07950 [Edwardsiella tarda]
MTMFNYDSKTNTVSLLGQTFTLDYFNRVEVPLLLTTLKWSPRMVLSWYINANLPVPRIAALIEAQEEIAEEERKAAAEREAFEAHRRANFPTPEERAEDEAKRKAREEQRQKFIRERQTNRIVRSAPRPFAGVPDGVCNPDWSR